jgi:hypothetical protein
VSLIDEAVREYLSREIYERRRSEVGSTTANTKTDDTDDEDLIGYDPIEPGLPPASSDKRKWWLDNGKPARSDIKPSQNGAVPNPNRPSNPFSPTDEPDWVTVPRMAPQTTFAPPPPNPRPTNGTRKLPPPFEPASVTSLANNFSQTSLNNIPASTIRSAGSASPLVAKNDDRRLSAASSTSSISRKAAPPVGRKPSHLTSSPSSASSPTLSTISMVSASRSPQVPQQKPRSTTIDHTGFAPPPRRVVGASPTIRSNYDGIYSDDRRENTTPPPPQPRRPVAARKVEDEPKPGLPPRPPQDLLGDNDGGMDGWEALKPT